MRRFLLAGLLILGTVNLFAQGGRRFPGQDEEEEEEEVLPSGDVLMRNVQAQLPGMPLLMTGFIRTRRDGEDQDRRLETELRFGDQIPHAIYTLTDALGGPLTKVKVSWPEGVPVFQQWDANGEEMPVPDPMDEVADTGLTWSDLSLSFLWWPGAEVTGSDRVKTRSSYVVQLPAPEGRDDLAEVRLWVDKKALFIVKAELRDQKGKVLKRIEVDSIKEIRDDFWMVKDLLIRDRKNGVRMGVRFLEVEELEKRDEP
jgi:hypothetical protein